MLRLLLNTFFLIILCLSASAQKKQNREKALDIFWGAKHSRLQMIAETIRFQRGEIVADIGTGDGLFIAALSMYSDGLTFFLEDIDSSTWHQNSFDSALLVFSAKSGRTPHHHFNYTLGTEQSTGLSHETFDKVLMIDTYHHLSNRDEMISDVVRLLRPGGEIAIMEALARRPGDIHPGCKKIIFSFEEIVSLMESKGMKLLRSKFIHKTAGRRNTLLIFTQT